MPPSPSSASAASSRRGGDSNETWRLLLALSAHRRHAGGSPNEAVGAWQDPNGTWCTGSSDDPRAQIRWINDRLDGAAALHDLSDTLIELYLPVLGASAERPVIVGHLGQSIDAQIATRSGDACYVTGRENMRHLHRMRALCDAVVVGAGTVATDDPRLTTRLVDGPSPVRVVIDPGRRLTAERTVFTDRAAPTLLVCAAGRQTGAVGEGELIGLPADEGRLAIGAIVAALRRRGLHALFVEGGGVTVTRWMAAGSLDRVQIATSPVLIGDGRPGLRLPPAPTMRECLRPPYRLYRMGEDLLWDFDLRRQRLDPERSGVPEDPPQRIL